ncbi:MAG TPA: saccharopine dehydrogenase family protein, partial [Verrucomicrobia bacterium]|nr:saccharopine dehydrogenase family protein [Verrucomicrobiota bacterium]
MSKVMIIGAGGVGSVVVHKCCQNKQVFSEVILASRTLSKCLSIQKAVRKRYGYEIQVEQIDADKVELLADLIRRHAPQLVVHVALPYQDLTIMEACLAAGVSYLDTANYEPPDVAKFEYKWQWDFQDRFREKGLMAVLGCGFDPGATNLFCAYAQKHEFDVIQEIDILDANGGDHGHPFATN